MDPQRKASVVGTLFVLAAVISWGIYFPYAKIVLKTISPASFLIIRLGVGALTLYLLNLRVKKNLRIGRADWWYLVAAGMIGIVVHQLIQLAGLKQTSATNTGWILTLNPPVIGILGWIWLKERVALHKIAGLVVAMIGVTLLVSHGDPAHLSLVHNWGDLLAFLSIGTWSVFTVMVKSRLALYEPLAVAALHMLIGFVIFAAIGGAAFVDEAGALTPAEWAIAILIGILPSGLAYYWWTAGLKRLPVIDISMYLFIEAIVATVVGWAVLGESFTLGMAFGAVVIVIGVWIAQSRWLDRKEWAAK